MPVDVSGTLRQALAKLEGEKARIDRQIAGLRQALDAGRIAVDGKVAPTPSDAKRGRKRMSPKERKRVSARMKAYWAKRRGKSDKKQAVKRK